MVLSQVLLLLFKECFSFKVLQGSPIHRKNSKEIFVNLKSFTWNMIKLLDVNLNTKWKKKGYQNDQKAFLTISLT